MQRGEIWLINLDRTVGAEIKETRPAVIVNDDAIGILPLKVIVLIADWKDHYVVAAWMVRLEPDDENIGCRYVPSPFCSTRTIRPSSRKTF